MHLNLLKIMGKEKIMIKKISDFRLAEYLLKIACSRSNVEYSDLALKFEDPEGFRDGHIYLGEPKNVGHTIFKIIRIFCENSQEIVGKRLNTSNSNAYIALSNYLRALTYGNNDLCQTDDEMVFQRLYQKPLIWIIMKNLICPSFNVKLNNVKLVAGNSAQVDITEYFDKMEDNSESFIFVNNIEDTVIRNVFLLISAIKAHELEPGDVIKDILESSLRSYLEGILLIAFSEKNKVHEFIDIITALLGIRLVGDQKKIASTSLIKDAQQTADHPTSWWFMGLIEQMLDSARGSDWSTHISLEKYVKEFWDEVEEIKRKKEKNNNFDGVPFNELLRLKSKQTCDYDTDHNKTLQALLSSDRVW